MGLPPGALCDADGNGVDEADLVAFSDCFLSGFAPGCEMMDFDGNSLIHVDDLDDCFVDAPADCNANGTEDLIDRRRAALRLLWQVGSILFRS